MNHKLSRRELFGVLGASGVAAGLAPVLPGRVLFGAEPPPAGAGGLGHTPAARVDGRVMQPRRELPILHQTQVLVVGAGPAGVAAAIAARRAGAHTTLVERYGYFGGLWTGGLVLLVIGHIVKGGRQVCQGIGEEMMRRLEKLDRGICNRRRGVNPTVDAEALKYLMAEMVTEARVDVFLHCWGVNAILDGSTVRGAVFESKSGRQAILADQVVDATGDGDLLGAAGAEHERRIYNIGLPCRIGNLDKVDPSQAGRARPPRHLGNVTPIRGVHWVNMAGPDADGLDVAALTRLELAHRRQIWKQLQQIRRTPGYEPVCLLETAPQLGVRITRVLSGVETLTLQGVKQNRTFPDVVAVGGAWHGDHQEWQIPYGALVPRNVENLLAAGRCISGEPRMADLIRVIPICFVTGQAAGCAAALAAAEGCRARDVDVPKLQKLLKHQEAYLGPNL
jgi:hypothetical protein